MTQRVVESNEYCDTLLELAAQEPDPFMRMARVAAFKISRFNTVTERLQKPFNPLLGETYEMVTTKYRSIVE